MMRARTTSHERPHTAGAAYPTISTQTWMARGLIDSTQEMALPEPRMAIREGTQLFVFPTPSPRVDSSRSATFASGFVRPATAPESPRIGIALGSPSQAPPLNFDVPRNAHYVSSRVPVQPPPLRLPPCPPSESTPELQQIQGETQRTKSSWKSFKNMFGRKNPHPIINELTRNLEDTVTPKSQDKSMHLPLRAEKKPRKWRSPNTKQLDGPPKDTAKKPQELEEVGPGNQSNCMVTPGNSTQSPTKAPRKSFGLAMRPTIKTSKHIGKVRSETPERKDSGLSMSPSTITTPETPQLDLAIPNPVMDRYSVMFAKLLRPEDPKTKTSLLERRQSKMQRQTTGLQCIPSSPGEGETTALDRTVPQRSMTSPQLTRLPSLSIKTNTWSSMHDPSHIRRSNTMPSGSTSPMVATVMVTLSPAIESPLASARLLSPPATGGAVSFTTSTPMTASFERTFLLPRNNSTSTLTPRQNASWEMLMSQPLSPYDCATPTSKSPSFMTFLRTGTPESLVQVSTARQINVITALKEITGADAAGVLAMRPKVVSLGGRERAKSTTALVHG